MKCHLPTCCLSSLYSLNLKKSTWEMSSAHHSLLIACAGSRARTRECVGDARVRAPVHGWASACICFLRLLFRWAVLAAANAPRTSFVPRLGACVRVGGMIFVADWVFQNRTGRNKSGNFSKVPNNWSEKPFFHKSLAGSFLKEHSSPSLEIIDFFFVGIFNRCTVAFLLAC